MSSKFTEGHPKKGGRTPGAKNKRTVVLDTFAKSICDGGMEKFQAEMNKLKGKEFVYAYLSVFEYVKPKLTRTTVDAGENTTVKISIKKTQNAKV